MKKIFLAITISLTLCLSAFADWADFGKYAKSNAEIIASGNFPDVVFMGDSITDAWPHRKAFFEGNKYVGRGISGQVTSQMLSRFRPDVIELKPKAVVILAGTNDIARNQGPISNQHIFGNIQSMCELAKANGIKPIICSVLPVYEYKWRKEIEAVSNIKELNDLLKNYAKKNKITYVDYFDAMKDERLGLPEKYSGDGVHPNGEGYQVMETLVKQAIENTIKIKSK